MGECSNLEYLNNCNSLETIKELEDNPMFHFSLSSKELFHSNYLSWLWNLDKTSMNGIGRISMNKFLKVNNLLIKYDDYRVYREKSNVDITIDFCKDKVIIHTIYIEIKIKSIPDNSQLEKYYNKISKIKNINMKRISFILITLDDLKFYNIQKGWNHLVLDSYTAQLKNYLNLNYSSDKLYIDNYFDLVEKLKKLLITETNLSNGTKLSFELFDKCISLLRVDDLVTKYYYEKVLNEIMIKANNSSQIKINREYGKWHELAASLKNNFSATTGYSKKNPEFSIFRNYNHNKKKSVKINYGIQVQDQRLTVFINIGKGINKADIIDLLSSSKRLKLQIINDINIILPNSINSRKFNTLEFKNSNLFSNNRNDHEYLSYAPGFVYKYAKIKVGKKINDFAEDILNILEIINSNVADIESDLNNL